MQTDLNTQKNPSTDLSLEAKYEIDVTTHNQLNDSDHYDTDYAQLERINAAADQMVEHLSTCCCNSCHHCIRAMAICSEAVCSAIGDAAIYTGKKIAQGADESSRVLILPPVRALDRVIRGPQKNDGWELPKNISMFAVNPLMTMAEVFMKANGDPTCIPLQPALARTFECVDLLASARKTRLTLTERLKRTAAGLTGLVFAGYAALYAATLADFIQDGTLDQLIPALPNEMIQQLHVSTWHALQWAVASVGGYIMMTNGYIFGKDLVLDKISDAWKSIHTDIKVDAIIRHLIQLEKITDLTERAAAQAAFQNKINENKGLWHFTDALGRTLEHVLSFAAVTPIRMARDTASNLTSYKPVVGKLQDYKAAVVRRLPALPHAAQPEEEKELLNPEAPSHRFGCCAKTAKALTGCFFQSSAEQKASELSNKKYEDLLEEVKNSYYRFAPATIYGGSREKRLAGDIQNHYAQAMRIYQHTGRLEIAPFGAQGEAANPDWQNEALHDETLVAFLKGDFANTGLPPEIPFARMAFFFNERLFQHFNRNEAHQYSAPAFLG
ncbi:MAG: hypothetical protein SFW66_06990 [Gammaproteobacteria bacterium]|nr:hypothetical protein [Gammaproteobacteria bacterium]